MTQNTDFGKEIKKKLIDIGRTNTWLCEEVAAKTGKYFDDSGLSKICRGIITPSSFSAIEAIKEILGLEEVTDNAQN